MIDGDDVGRVANAPDRHRFGEPRGGSDLCGDGIVGIDDVPGPVDVDSAWDMTGEVLLGGAAVGCRLDARLEGGRRDVAAHVNHPNTGIAQMAFEPIGRDQQVSSHGRRFLVGFLDVRV